MTAIAQELRHAVRGLVQRPLFTLVAVVSVAIGVGANTAIFSVFNALLLRAPGGIGEAERVVELGRTRGGSGFDSFTWREIEALRAGVGPIEMVSAYRLGPMSLTTTGDGVRVMSLAVNHEYFDIMGISPAVGRFIAADEDVTGGDAAVAVVSHRFWRERLAGDANVVGRTIELNRRAFTIVGVAPADFHSHSPIVQPEVYVPIAMMPVMQPGFDAFDQPNASWVLAVGRLRAGTTVAQANVSLDALFAGMREADPSFYEGRGAVAAALTAMPGGGRSAVTGFLGLLLGLTGLILLVTCANVAGMLLARAAGREREIAVRLALGAGRRRLVFQLLVESVVLFLAGGIAGVLLATWGASVFASIRIPAPFPIRFDFAPDARVLLFGMSVALLTGAVFGLAPALQSTSLSLVAVLKNEAARSGSAGGRLRRVFVAGQVALTVLLLVSATLFLRALQRASTIDTGFSAENVALVSFNLATDGYDDARGRLFLRELNARLLSTPGIDAAGVATDLPLDLGNSGASVYPEGVEAVDENGVGATFSLVDGGYFAALDIDVLEGRAFTDSDRDGTARVVMVSRSFAEQVWPGESAIGKRLRWDDAADEPRTVVGVVGEVKNQMVMETTEPMVYLPLDQQYEAAVTVLARSPAGTERAAEILRNTMRSMDARLSTGPVESMVENSAVGLLPQRIAAVATITLGSLALLLSVIGVYGVIAYMVAQRTREIGVRMALGADRRSVVGLVLANGLRVALPGAVVGAVLALGLGFLMRAFILGVAPADPVALATAPVLLLGAVAAACWFPAARAAAIEPVKALRSD